MQLNLKKFDPKTIENRRIRRGGIVTAVLGNRYSGKTTLLNDLMKYTDVTPEMLDTSKIEQIMKKQRNRKVNNDNKSVLLYSDDPSGCVLNNKPMHDLFMNGAHLHASLFLTLTHCTDIPPGLRGNVDYVFFLDNGADTRKVFECFFGICPNLNTFNQLVDKVTNYYGCLVLDNTCTSGNLEDMLFWYKAPKPEEPEEEHLYEEPETVKKDEWDIVMLP